jgi:hypothetical protein
MSTATQGELAMSKVILWSMTSSSPTSSGSSRIDEYRIFVHPIQIGEGKRLFRPSKEKVMLRLSETLAFGNGVVLLRHERLRPRGGN